MYPVSSNSSDVKIEINPEVLLKKQKIDRRTLRKHTIQPANSRKAISLSRRLDVIRLLEEDKTQLEIANETGISQALVSRIYRRKKIILGDTFENEFHKRKRCKRGKFYDIDRAMTEWFILSCNNTIPVSTGLVRIKAIELSRKLGFEGFRPSFTWIKSWKEKNSIESFQESTHVKEETAAVHTYKLDDVYTVSEMGIQYMAVPEQFETKPLFKLDQLTVLIACNKTGSDKRQLLVVGEEPIEPSLINLPCEYVQNDRAWMTSDTFVAWLLGLDKEMISQKRKIMLILRESPVHLQEVEHDLSNIKLVFVPPENADIGLPCEHGIANSLRLHYRKDFFQMLRLDVVGYYSLAMKDALHLLHKAWHRVTPKVIQASFEKAGVQSGSITTDENEEVTIPGISDEAVEFVDQDSNLQYYGMPTDDDICKKVLAVKDDEDIERELDPLSEWPYGSNQMSAGALLKILDSLRSCLEKSGVHDFSNFYTVESQVFSQIHFNDAKSLGSI